MAGVFIVFTALLLCLPDSSDGINIVQSPPSLFKSPERSAELQCYHGDSSYTIMYWYQQTRKGALELIGYLQNTAIVPEEKFKLRPAVLLLSLQHRHVKMAGVFIVFTALLLCLPDFSDGINIVQSPSSLFKSPGHSAELQCSHDDSSYKQINWYQQTRKGALELIGYLSYTEGAGGSAGMFCEHDGGFDYKQMYWYRQLRGQGIQLLVFSMFGSDPQFEKDFNEERPAVLLLSLQHRHVKMAGVFIAFTASLLCLQYFSAGIKIVQSPPSLFESPERSAELQCYHGDSSYNVMYWYQQTRNGALELIGYEPAVLLLSIQHRHVKMAGVFIVFTTLLLCLPDLNGIKIDQSPPSLFESPGHSAELQCSHNITNYDQMYWYQQSRKGAFHLIGYLYNERVNLEEKFKKSFNLTGNARKAGPSQGIGVSQTPQVLLQGAGGSAGMFCEHDGDNTYTQMYWYRQLRGQGIQLLVFSLSGSAPQFEKDFNEERYEVNRSAVTKGSLKIKNLEPDFSDGNVRQSPPSLFESPGNSAELQCSHNITNYEQMYWYQQSQKGALHLIGYLNYEDVNPEENFKERFKLTGDARKAGPSHGIGVSQTPQVLLQGAGGSAGMFCEHDGDITYNQMYWYRQLRGQGIQLLVFSDFYKDPEFEKDFSKDRYEVNRSAVTKGSLKIKNLEPDLNGIKIDQSPPSLFESPGRSAELNCSHDDSNYDRMYWYQQTRKGALELIGYQYGEIFPEEKFKERFKMTGKATEKGFLTISSVTVEDSAVYFCAASIHSAADHLSPLR
ncbi:UNVERIFIED_CONTAM: hypothetical protein FKN15_059607 [Acipenser sinensis]